MKKLLAVCACAAAFLCTTAAEASYHFSNFKGRPPIHTYGGTSKTPRGMTPAQIKTVYHLPQTGGAGTIVIVGAYDDPTIESDFGVFSNTFGLPACTTANGCFTKHKMSSTVKANSDWSMETSLDVEWAHAIAPTAHIMLVEATTPSGAHLLEAIDYAAKVRDASAISMSWGGGEFPEELSLDAHFKSVSNAPFFASSGDNGTGASWPASSPSVIGVGGTSVSLAADASLKKETAWSGSGGGISAYESEPAYQKDYAIPRAHGMRAIPDVSYDADPATGFPVYRKGYWQTVGGTSAGAPQWAAIAALGAVSIDDIYKDKSNANHAQYFRDIVSGTNGGCGYLCTARAHYDYVTGLGSPLTARF